jgi:hypothetical protein
MTIKWDGLMVVVVGLHAGLVGMDLTSRVAGSSIQFVQIKPVVIIGEETRLAIVAALDDVERNIG